MPEQSVSPGEAAPAARTGVWLVLRVNVHVSFQVWVRRTVPCDLEKDCGQNVHGNGFGLRSACTRVCACRLSRVANRLVHIGAVHGCGGPGSWNSCIMSMYFVGGCVWCFGEYPMNAVCSGDCEYENDEMSDGDMSPGDTSSPGLKYGEPEVLWKGEYGA